jgi:uncharacterized NAD(P)/FAD-binding protein YdhS
MQKVDIAIAGSGISCTATLIEVFRKLIADETARPKVFITVFEKSYEFWYGVPYGSRSSVNALTITSVYDFFTDEKERASFFEWFKQNKEELIDYYLSVGGITSEEWLRRNSDALYNEDYKNVYLPRFMCGKYTQSKFDSLLYIVEDRGLAELNLITAEVIDVSPVKDEFIVSYELADKTVSKLVAAKVVIATGSAPVKEVVLPEGNDAVTLINNLYEPRIDKNINNIIAALEGVENKEERNVLLIGSNASSIEFLYLLGGLPQLTGLINKLVVVSRSGLYPYAIIKKTMDKYPADYLEKLKEKGNYNVEALVDAAAKDIKIAVKKGVIVHYIDRIIGLTMEMLQSLDEDAKKQFMGVYGIQLSNMFRRSGTDYKGGEIKMLEEKKLIMIKGGFSSMDATDEGGVLHYVDTDTEEKETYAAKFKIAINCTGANDLDKSSSRLIYNLVHNDIAEVNLSGKGFLVNKNFEAAPNLYIMGPLLGGNKNERIHFWHLENASRIMYLAPYLADCLLASAPAPQKRKKPTQRVLVHAHR